MIFLFNSSSAPSDQMNGLLQRLLELIGVKDDKLINSSSAPSDPVKGLLRMLLELRVKMN